ncbi:oligosaccharide flippase family protein, partial [Vibrio parahaemolyticus]|nr:oligosaccharide flippase family protein [Vibrio parahaemolyticus]
MKHYLKSACWLLGEKGVSFFCVLLVNFQVAKYLGPDLFGSFSFAQAISSLLLILSGLGIHIILLRDFSNVNSRKDILYAASLLLRGGFSIILLLLAFILYRKSILTIE